MYNSRIQCVLIPIYLDFGIQTRVPLPMYPWNFTLR